MSDYEKKHICFTEAKKTLFLSMKTASQFSTSETVNKKYSFNFVYSASPMRL